MASPSPLLSDSLGHTPAKRSERIGQTTRFYGISFLKGKLKDSESDSFDERNDSFNSKSILFETYGFFLCTLLVFSILIVTLGVSLALAGHLTPKKVIETRNIGNHTASNDVHIVLKYNRMLNTFVISGMALLSIGLALFIFLMVLPFCSAYEVTIRKYKEYNLAPNSDSEEDAGVIINKIVTSECESVVMGTADESPANEFATIHQQLKPTDVQKSLN